MGVGGGGGGGGGGDGKITELGASWHKTQEISVGGVCSCLNLTETDTVACVQKDFRLGF